MDGEDGSSTSSSSSSTCSSSSSECDSNEKLENVQILGSSFVLPQRLCEDEKLFREFVSLKSWDALDEVSKYRLMKFLPNFPFNDRREKRLTIEKLFKRENFRFSSPLSKFYEKLKDGNFSPNAVKMKKLFNKYKKKALRRQECAHTGRVMRSILSSRDSYLRNSTKRTNPSSTISGRMQSWNEMDLSYPTPVLQQAQYRAKIRYFQELAAIRSEVGESENLSEDENYPDGPPPEFFKKNQRHFGTIENDTELSDSKGPVVYGTLGNSTSQGTLESNIGSSVWLRTVLGMHRYRRTKREMHPELQTTNVKLSEIRQRVNLPPGSVKKINVAPKMNNHQPKVRRPTKKEQRKKHPAKAEKRNMSFKREKSSSSESQRASNKRKYQPYDNRKYRSSGREALYATTPPSVKSENVGSESESPVESDDDSSFIDPVESPKPAIKPMRAVLKKPQSRYQKQKKRCPSSDSNARNRLSSSSAPPNRIIQSPVPTLIPPSSPLQLPPPPTPLPPTIMHPVPIKLEDLEGIDMMDLPVDLDDSIVLDNGIVNNEIELDNIKIEVAEPEDDIKDNSFLALSSHACFLSLVRALFPAPTHRASPANLSLRLRMLTASSLAPSVRLKFFHPPVEEWCDALQSALSFLAGDTHPQPPDFVPYVQYLAHLQVYQWIGAGRDSDSQLLPLNQYWLERHQHLRSSLAPKLEAPPSSPVPQIAPVEVTTPAPVSPSASPTVTPPSSDRSATPPPAICPTTWTVKSPSLDEVEEFHRQERERFSRPHEAYTYNTFGYDSIVGPLIKNGASAAAAAASAEEGSAGAARGHALLAKWRPRCVTLLALVRDAVARLPNGEGTRADIATLLTMSQYMVGTDGTITGAVSGALDRLHAPRPRRPTVRYSSRRKVWMYLHRHMNTDEIVQLYKQTHSQPAPAKPRAKKAQTNQQTKKDKAAQQKLLLQQQRDKEAVDTLLEQEGKTEPVIEEIPACIIPESPIVEEVFTTTVADSDSDVDVDDSGIGNMVVTPPMEFNVAASSPLHVVTTTVTTVPVVHKIQPLQQTQTVQLVQTFQAAQNPIKRTGGASLLRSGGPNSATTSTPSALSPVSRSAKSLISPGALLDTSPRRTVTNKVSGVGNIMVVGSGAGQQRNTSLASVVMTSTVTPSSMQPLQLQLSPQTHQHTHTVQLSTGQTVHLASGQTVQLSSGQKVQLATTPHQTVQVQRVQGIQGGAMQSVQTLQNVQTLQGVQTVQLPALQLAALRKAAQQQSNAKQQQLLAKVIAGSQGGHVILEGNVIRPASAVVRRQTPVSVTSVASSPITSPASALQRTSSPVQIRAISQVGNATQQTQQVVRVMSPALGLARLTKPLLLASKNIILQQSSGAANVPTSGSPTLLLTNSQLSSVRTAVSSASTAPGSVLLTGAQLKAATGQTVLLGGQQVRLAPSAVSSATTTVRLHPGTFTGTAGTSVLQLASGHHVKVVPRHLLARLVPSVHTIQQQRKDQPQ